MADRSPPGDGDPGTVSPIDRRGFLRAGTVALGLALGGRPVAGASGGPEVPAVPIGGHSDSRSAAENADFSPIGTVDVAGASEAVVGTDGQTAYLAINGGFAAVDVSDPADPTVLAAREDTGIQAIQDVKVDGDRLIAVGPASRPIGPNGFGLYDVSDPSSPELLAVHETEYAIHNGYLRDDVAYLIDNGAAELVVVDVTNDRPVEVGRWGLSDAHKLHDLWIQGDRGYLCYWNDGTVILDVSDPTSPSRIGRLRETSDRSPDHDHYVMVDEGQTLLAIGKELVGPRHLGVELWDVSSETDPQFLSEIDPPAGDGERTSHNFDLVDGYLYTSWYYGGVRVHNVADPSNPVEVAAWNGDAAFWTAKVAEPNALLVASDVADGALYTFDDPRDGGCDAAEFSPLRVYQAGDRVTYQGSLWEAQSSAVWVAPGESTAHWNRISEC